MTDATAYLLRPFVIAISICLVLVVGMCVSRDIIHEAKTTTVATNYTIFTNIEVTYNNAGESNDDYLWKKRTVDLPTVGSSKTGTK